MVRGISLLIALIMAVSTFSLANAQSVKTNRWVKDFEQVRTAIARHYADLDEALERQGINPTALNNVTISAIRSAQTDDQARLAIKAFIAAFGDPRLTLGPPERQALTLAKDEALLIDAEAGPVCNALRFKRYDPEPFGLGILKDYSFNVLISQNNVFGAGIVESGPRGVGYLRVPSFDTRDYHSACLRAWRNRQAESEEPCDGNCLSDITDRIIPNMVIDDFARRIEGFAERRVGTVVIDLTGTTGDGEWASALGTLLAGDAVSCPAVQVPRTAEWRRRFTAMNRRLGKVGGDSTTEALIEQTRDRLSQLEDQTKSTCRRPESVFTDRNFDLAACNGLTTVSYSACGVLSKSPGISIGDREATDILYHPDYFSIANSPKPSKILVVVDDQTSGAAEQLAGMLQDAGVAEIVGRQSAGAGCLAIEGEDSRIILRRSKLELRIPNCRQLRRDGRNSAAGIDPDVEVAWSGEANSDEAREAVFDAILP